FFSHPDPFVEFVLAIFGLLILVFLANSVYQLFASRGFSPIDVLNTIIAFITGNSILIWAIRIFLVFLTVVMIFFFAYWVEKLKGLRVLENNLLYPDIPENVAPVNAVWQEILEHLESDNETNWRQAIIEA